MSGNFRVLPASQFAVSAVDWIWPESLGAGILALFDGDPGLGKSLIMLDLCARLSTGRPFPDGKLAPGGPAKALIINAEDSAERVLRPRLAALGADLDRVILWDRAPKLLRLPTDLNDLDSVLADVRPRLVVFDPIASFIEGGLSSEVTVRRALDPLSAMVEHRGCGANLVRHLNKTGSSCALYRGSGSIAVQAACRITFLAARDPQQTNRCVLAQVKNNYAELQPSLAYTVTKTDEPVPTFTWVGASALLAKELLAAAPPPSPELTRTCEFLLGFLANGPQSCRAIWNAAQQQGLSRRTLQRAKRELDIESQRLGENGTHSSYWLLPGQALPPPNVPEEYSLEPWLAPLRERFPPPSPLDEL
jgi:hypothetical protein